MVTGGFGSTGAYPQPLLRWASSPSCLSAGSRHTRSTQQSGESGQVLGPPMGDNGSWWLRPIRPGRPGLVGDVLSVVFSSSVVIQGFANGLSQRGTEEERALSAAEWEAEWGGRTRRTHRDLVEQGHVHCTLFPFGSGHRGGMGVSQNTSVTL